ncbi:anti-sigma factor [Alicyclobacillus sp. ALC3]|uniref:anti-sigma factor n=1 Tax=Alicyclobacillus sp. ALC3 TaxID=2796143 RepID=UPI002377D9DD|nr:anti-sigma factor [Alicyclobacillus sp. ALC3]WDL97715.1 anti-sigma factor [Alicyclobacillus sp. ALC3]
MAKTDDMCALLTEYVLGELTDSQMREYEKHLAECDSCQSECESLWSSHKLLLTDVSSDAPSQWLSEQKSQILAHAFSRRKPRFHGGPMSRSSELGRSRRIGRRWTWLVSSAVLVGCLAVAGILVHNASVQRAPTPPVNLLGQWRLVAAPTYPRAQGMALEVHRLQNNNLIVYVNHVPVQSQWGCYGVWGLANGQWHSLGEFTVGNHGNGAITIGLDIQKHYNKLEITLEPRWGDATPEGPQVLRSPVVNV